MSKYKHMISPKRVEKIISVARENSFYDTCKVLGIKPSSLRKRLQEMKKYYDIDLKFNGETTGAKVLLMDIETTQMLLKVWGLIGNQYIQHHRIVRDWFIASWAGKWLGDQDWFGAVVTPEEAVNMDDERIVKLMWEKFNEADIIIAHNGDRFDIKKLNTRFLIHRLPPPTPYKSIDTLFVAKKYFKFSSNKLDYLTWFIERKRKLETNIDLWDRVEAGDQEALDYMFKYNGEDVVLLEDVYLELRPWIKSHPNMMLYVHSFDKLGQCGCSNCGKLYDFNEIEWNGVYSTTVSQFKTFRCDCGAIVRTRKSFKVSPLVGTAN